MPSGWLGMRTLFPGPRRGALVFLRMHIAFLSCIAFRREAVAGKDYAPRFATNLAQAYMFLDALAPGRGTCTPSA